MIDGQTFFDQPLRNNLMTYDIIWEIATGQGDNYAAGCLLDYNYFKKYYKMMPIDLSKQQEEGAKITFIIEEAKETVLHFSQATVRVLWMSW